MITWNLHLKMAEKKWRITDLAQASGITRETISKFYHGTDIKGVEMDTLSAFCKSLNCQPGDLLVYVDEEDKQQKDE